MGCINGLGSVKTTIESWLQKLPSVTVRGRTIGPIPLALSIAVVVAVVGKTYQKIMSSQTVRELNPQVKEQSAPLTDPAQEAASNVKNPHKFFPVKDNFDHLFSRDESDQSHHATQLRKHMGNKFIVYYNQINDINNKNISQLLTDMPKNFFENRNSAIPLIIEKSGRYIKILEKSEAKQLVGRINWDYFECEKYTSRVMELLRKSADD